MSAVGVLDHVAVFVFALTGALTASRAQLDIVGFAFLAVLTGLGGGTVRDVLLDREVLWIDRPSYLGFAVAAAILVFFTAHLLESRRQTLYWVDALALGSAVAAGTGIAVNDGQSWPIVLFMGVATGTLGGLMRDVVANEVPLVLKHGELYVTAALAGTAIALVALWLGVDAAWALGAGAVVCFGLRAGSIALGWRLPVYGHEPPQEGKG